MWGTNRTLTGGFLKIKTNQKYSVICLYDSNTLQRINIMCMNIYIYISLINSHSEQDMVVEHAQNAMGWPFYLRTG